MEVAALAGLLAVGYALTKGSQQQVESVANEEEGFESQVPWNGGQPPPLYQQDKTPPGAPTIPGKPRQPRALPDGEMDLYYKLPSGGSAPPQPVNENLYPRSLVFGSPTLTPQAPQKAVTPQVRFNTDGAEAPPVYNSGKTMISPLTGIPMKAEEFTHNNMVPFFRGSVKQNMTDEANQQRLDSMVGSGSVDIGKREQAPLFEPHREPMGNIHGLESSTDFMQDRIRVSTNRAFERPVEPTRVGPGVAQGYSAFPEGGFQQFEINDIMRQRQSIDELRVASNPRITYSNPIIQGKAVNDMPAQIGEVRKYNPDTFYLNETGERNFVTAGENTKPMERAAQVMKFQTREETSTEYMGAAASADFEATYTVPSFRAPLVRQHDGFGFRNADGSTYGVKNTDATNNDFGRNGIELPVNQRNVTSERGQGLNLTTAGGPKALTVYDPNDVARTTVRESTGANDWIGGAAPASAATKLTVYDPSDIMRITNRNTMAEPDKALNVTRSGVPGQATLSFPDGMRATTKATISANSAYGGTAGPAAAGGAKQTYDVAYAMRQNPTKEVVASGRRPVAGNGSLPIFNGEDNINMSFRRLDSDSLNDRANAADRVQGLPAGVEVIGLQRPRQPLKMDISRDRNIHEILDSLDENPYALPIHKIAQHAQSAGAGPAAMAAMSIGGGW
jgi:hypothetical protein